MENLTGDSLNVQTVPKTKFAAIHVGRKGVGFPDLEGGAGTSTPFWEAR